MIVVAMMMTAWMASATELAVTPFGLMPKSCVHAVSANQMVVNEPGKTMIRNKETQEDEQIMGRCSEQVSILAKEGQRQAEPNSPMLPDGWAAYAFSGKDAQSLTSYNGTWTVPDTPQDEGQQVLFLFTGLQNLYDENGNALRGGVTNIIQPVLQFGVSEAGGGDYWALASWYVDSNNHAHYSVLTQTESGNVIVGTMVLNVTSNIWVISSIDNTTGNSTVLDIATHTKEPNAFVTLEVYTISKCLEYPTGNVTFANLVFAPAFTPTWTPLTEKGCEESVTINSDGTVTLEF